MMKSEWWKWHDEVWMVIMTWWNADGDNVIWWSLNGDNDIWWSLNGDNDIWWTVNGSNVNL
jgi:hypothetical protein